MKYITLNALLVCVGAMSLGGCGGAIDATIGGTVSGLSGNTNVVLQDNAGDNLTVSTNGTFTFAKQIEAGSTYDVTVLTQPNGETCVVENAIGTVEQSIGNVNSVVVDCNVNISANNEVLGMVVNGLTTGKTVTLNDNGNDPITLTGNASGTQAFVFPTPLAIGATYNVVITSETGGATCQLQNNIGTISSTSTTEVKVTGC